MRTTTPNPKSEATPFTPLTSTELVRVLGGFDPKTATVSAIAEKADINKG